MRDHRASLYEEAGRQFAPAIARLARSHEYDADRARDLEQEIHCALWQSLERFDGQCSLKTWVYRVAHNVAVDHVRKAGRRPLGVSLDQVAERPAPEGGEDRAADAHVLGKVRALVRELPPLDAQIILLWLEGESAADIAEITGSNASAIATRTHRIRERLTAAFADPTLQEAQP